MSFLCLLGLHRRSSSAKLTLRGTCTSLCQNCGRPMVKGADGRWTVARSL